MTGVEGAGRFCGCRAWRGAKRGRWKGQGTGGAWRRKRRRRRPGDVSTKGDVVTGCTLRTLCSRYFLCGHVITRGLALVAGDTKRCVIAAGTWLICCARDRYCRVVCDGCHVSLSQPWQSVTTHITSPASASRGSVWRHAPPAPPGRLRDHVHPAAGTGPLVHLTGAVTRPQSCYSCAQSIRYLRGGYLTVNGIPSRSFRT